MRRRIFFPFPIHADAHVRQPHVDATDALGIAPEPIRLQDLLERRPVLFLPELSGPLGTDPVVVPGARDAGQLAQLPHRQHIPPVRQGGADGLESFSGAVHGYFSGPSCSFMTFFKKAICCWSTRISCFMRLAASSAGAAGPVPPVRRTPPRVPS